MITIGAGAIEKFSSNLPAKCDRICRKAI
jgi:hypothetical protein